MVDGIDLRGLGPQELGLLLGGAVDFRRVKSAELEGQLNRALEMYKIMNAPGAKPSSEYSKPYVKDGKVVMDRVVNGEVVGQVEAPRDPVHQTQSLSETYVDESGRKVKDRFINGVKVGTVRAPENEHNDPGGRWFQSPDGDVRYFSSSNPPPKGWTGLEDPTTKAISQLVMQDKENKQEERQKGLDVALSERQVTDNGRTTELSDTQMQAYADLYNANDPNFMWKKTAEPTWRSKSKWEKVPKQPAQSAAAVSSNTTTPTISSQAEFDKLPKGSVYINAEDGKTYRK